MQTVEKPRIFFFLRGHKHSLELVSPPFMVALLDHTVRNQTSICITIHLIKLIRYVRKSMKRGETLPSTCQPPFTWHPPCGDVWMTTKCCHTINSATMQTNPKCEASRLHSLSCIRVSVPSNTRPGTRPLCQPATALHHAYRPSRSPRDLSQTGHTVLARLHGVDSRVRRLRVHSVD
jgi:hypothetical protein